MKARLLLCVVPFLFISADPAGDQFRLEGVWDVTAMIENGEVVSPASIRAYFLKDGQVTIKGQSLTLTNPTTLQKREILFVIDSGLTPKTIDISGSVRTGSRGIYMLDGNTLMLCIGGPDNQWRPASFNSMPGSHTLLMTMKRVGPVPPDWVPAPPPPTPSIPQATPIVTKDDEYRKNLPGTWGYQDDEKIVMNTFNPDGTFSMTVTWKNGFKRVFHEDVRVSGTWRIESGTLVTRVTASSDNQRIGQVYSMRINVMYTTEMIYTDQSGHVRTEWKVR